MSPDQPYRICPSLEEILAAAEPGASEEYRASIRQRLQSYLPQDEALDGAIRFLQDHDFDFDALYHFLEPTPLLVQGRTKVLKLQPSRIMGIAALIAAVFLASWYYLVRYQPDRQVAEAAFYEPGLPVYAGIGGQKAFQEMMSAYRGGEIEEGLSLYRHLSPVQGHNDTLQYFGAWLYYQNKQTDSAAMLFELVSSQEVSGFAEKAAYMQAISIFLAGNRLHARLLLERIAQQPTHSFSLQARSLLHSVNHW